MKKIYLIPISVLFLGGFLSLKKAGVSNVEKYFQNNGHKNAAGSTTARTGAPGEQNCTSCHAGSAQSGASENNLFVLNGLSPVTSYTPGSSYTVTLAMASNPAKKGFQAIALDASNNMAGNFTAQIGNTNVTTQGTKKYVNHTVTSNSSTTPIWLWTWAAPATQVGDVTFYVATNKANNNGQNSGDVIYLSQHVISSTLGTSEPISNESNFSAGYAASKNALVLDFTTFSAGDMHINLLDLSGKSVLNLDLGKAQIGKNLESIQLPESINNGIYIVNFFVNNTVMSSKISIQK
jgi:hypothetical protein